MNEKSALRKYFRQRRAAVSDREVKEAALTQRLLSHRAFLSCDRVFCYVSIDSEADTRAFLNACFRLKKDVAVPKCGQDGMMQFYAVHSLCELSPAAPFGIPEPEGDVIAVPTEKTLCVVPGLAFDRAGFRLGYGGGYYDRFLPSFPGFSLGLCFDECLTDALPRGAHDVSLQAVLTPDGLYTF